MTLLPLQSAGSRGSIDVALGNSGTGKSHIALGLGLAACQKVLSIGFNSAAAIVHEAHGGRDEKQLLRLQRQLAAYKLLIVDELGYVPRRSRPDAKPRD
jgi:DNA replication protein DnaC